MRISCQPTFLLALNLFFTSTLGIDNTAVPTETIATEATPLTHADPTVAVLLKAGSLAWAIILLLGTGIFRLIMLMLWPVLAIVSTLWRLLVVAPWQLFMGIAHVLYPVVLFCFVAVLCGIVIGGCAGFAAEAVSWFTVTATWGRQVRQKLPAPAIDRYDHDISSVVSYEDHDVDDDDDTDDHDAAGAGEHEHIWDPKGKQPLRRHPGLHTHTASLPEQRFKVQQTIADVDLDKYQNEWVWEEEEEEDIDVFPRRRRWRTSVG